jgi:hypothetical protein
MQPAVVASMFKLHMLRFPALSPTFTVAFSKARDLATAYTHNQAKSS